MLKKSLEGQKQSIRLMERNLVKLLGCTGTVLRGLEETKEEIIENFLINEGIYNTETLKAMEKYINSQDNYIPTTLSVYLED